MNADIPQQLANEAYAYLLLCEGGLDLEAELPAWADGWIMRLKHIPDTLFYLSTCKDKSQPDIWSALRNLGINHQADRVRTAFLKMLSSLLENNIRSAYQIAHALANADLSLDHSDHWPNFTAEFSTLDHAPITEKEITEQMRTWLSKAI